MKLLKSLFISFCLSVSISSAGDLDIHPPFKQVGTDVSLSSSNAATVTLDAYFTATGTYAPIMVDAIVAEAAGIVKGKAVYVNGQSGGVITVGLADNTLFAKSHKVLGLAAETASNGAAIKITKTGRVMGLNTSAFSAGDILHLTTNGNYALTPTVGTHIPIGHVVTSDISAGVIYVDSDDLSYELRGPTDHDIILATGSDDATRKILFQNKSGTDLITIDGLGNMDFNLARGINSDTIGLTFLVIDSASSPAYAIVGTTFEVTHAGAGDPLGGERGAQTTLKWSGQGTQDGVGHLYYMSWYVPTGNYTFGDLSILRTVYSYVTDGLYAHTTTSLTGLEIGTMGGSSGDTMTVTNIYGIRVKDIGADLGAAFSATWTVGTQVGIQIDQSTEGDTNNYGLVLNGNGAGADIVLGLGRNAKIYYDGADLVINPRAIGSGNTVFSAGNVGIGTVPEAKLHVDGTIIVKNNSPLGWKDSGGSLMSILHLANDDTVYLDNPVPNKNIVFRTGASYTTRLFINGTDGNVGIGTASPTSKLHVVGLPVYANNAAAIAGGLTVGAFYRTNADPDPVMVVH